MDVARRIFFMMWDLANGWQSDEIGRVAAALSYYAIFSLAPLLVVIITIAGVFFGQSAVEGVVVEQFGTLLGTRTASLLSNMIAAASETERSLFATIIGLGTLLFGATNLFLQLEKALNDIWNVETEGGRGIWYIVRKRLIAFAYVLSLGLLLILGLVSNTALTDVVDLLNAQTAGLGTVLQVLNVLITITILTFFFALIYRFLPEAQIQWGDVWPGSFVTAILFTLGQFLIGLYLGRSDVSSAYGAAGSLVVLLIWLFYSMQIFLIGAEFTQVYSGYFGSKQGIGAFKTREMRALPDDALPDDALPEDG